VAAAAEPAALAHRQEVMVGPVAGVDLVRHHIQGEQETPRSLPQAKEITVVMACLVEVVEVVEVLLLLVRQVKQYRVLLVTVVLEQHLP
jgi:hypothetical protein